MRKTIIELAALSAVAVLCVQGSSYAQSYPAGLIDKTIATIGGEMVTISDIESELQMMHAQGRASDGNMRCEILERLLTSKLYLVQAKLDSLTVDQDVVAAELNSRIDQLKTQLGGEKEAEEYFGKPLYKLRQEWRDALQDQSLVQKEQQKIAGAIPPVTPYDVQEYLNGLEEEDIPVVPVKYQLSQICIYPDRENAKLAVKERLLAIRERIIAGERFSTLARLYSQDPGSARRGGELGMASKNIFWPAFSDAAMSLKSGVVSQIVETPDGFHIIEVIDRNGDMFNARHILLKPEYTSEDMTRAFSRLDSLKTLVKEGKMTFSAAARFYSEDPATRTNGGQMSDPGTGSSYYEIDQLKPQDYNAINGLAEGDITEPIESVDDEGRGNTVYKIIRVDKILPAHTATFTHDYNELMNATRMSRQNEALENFVKEKIKSTYIIIDDIFKDCDFDVSLWTDKIRK